jgi:hypothetical protein
VREPLRLPRTEPEEEPEAAELTEGLLLPTVGSPEALGLPEAL